MPEENEYSEYNYRQRVKTMAEEFHAHCDEQSKSYSDCDDWLHESVDGSRAVFMYAGAWSTCTHSRNRDQMFEEDMGLEGCDSLDDVMCRAAYYAMRQDVFEYLQDDATFPDPELQYTVSWEWGIEFDQGAEEDDPDPPEDIEQEEQEETFDTLEKAKEFYQKKVKDGAEVFYHTPGPVIHKWIDIHLYDSDIKTKERWHEDEDE